MTTTRVNGFAEGGGGLSPAFAARRAVYTLSPADAAAPLRTAPVTRRS